MLPLKLVYPLFIFPLVFEVNRWNVANKQHIFWVLMTIVPPYMMQTAYLLA
jgi:hypothetical protein